MRGYRYVGWIVGFVFTLAVWIPLFLHFLFGIEMLWTFFIWGSGMGIILFSFFQYRKRWKEINLIAQSMIHTPQLEHHLSGNDEFSELVQMLNRLGERITKEEQLRNQLIADIAHELRTPLTVLRGQLEGFAFKKKEIQLQDLLPLIDETIRMQRMIQDLQELSLAESKQMTLNRGWISFDTWLEEIIQVLQIKAEEKQISLQTQGKIEKEVYWDSLRMKQVLINLIGNAIQYTQAGGKVLISVQEKVGKVNIRIRDNGPGIAPEKLPYVFQRFVRGESSRNRSSGGVGLGLAIAKEFVEIHGGRIGVESELGEGTMFDIMIPIFPDH
jgi:signal transduction histidine kinase